MFGPQTGLVESETVELKVSGIDDALADLCALANTSGGALYLGVANDGRVALDFDVSDTHQRLVANKVRDLLQVEVAITVADTGGHPYLAIRVERKKKPIYLRGTYYRRVGTVTNSVTESAELTALILAQTSTTWDALSADIPLADAIDHSRLEAFVRSAQGRKNPRLPASVSADHPVEHVLNHIADHLAVDGEATNAAVLLFGRDPQRVAPHARVTILAIRTTDDITPYPDCAGSVFEQIDEALRTVMNVHPPHVSFPSSAAGGDVLDRTRRQETPVYDALAVKEAIANAVVHRDYALPGAEVEIKMYPDRLVITNPGELPGRLTLPMLRESPHPSIKRNPLIAAACFKDYYVERYGMGTVRMIERCQAAKLPEPVFSVTGGFFSATFYKDPLRPEHLDQLDLNPRQVVALAHVREVGRIDSATYETLVVGTRPTRARDLEDLVARGLLRKMGTKGPGVHWVRALGGDPGPGT